MSSKVNKATYEQMVNEDLAWLRAMPDCLENAHVQHIVADSIACYYPPQGLPPAPAEPPEIPKLSDWRGRALDAEADAAAASFRVQELVKELAAERQARKVIAAKLEVVADAFRRVNEVVALIDATTPAAERENYWACAKCSSMAEALQLPNTRVMHAIGTRCPNEGR